MTDPTPPARATLDLAGQTRRAIRWLRDALADHHRLLERQALRDRPWEEEFLHWAWDGDSWQLHGHRPPPTRARRLSVTSDGWCPALPTTRPPDRSTVGDPVGDQ